MARGRSRRASEQRRGLLDRWGGVVQRRRVVVVVAWVLLLASAIALYDLADSQLGAPDYTIRGSESDRVAQEIAERFPDAGAEQAVIVFRSNSISPTSPAFQNVVRKVLRDVRPLTVDVRGPYDRPGTTTERIALAAVALGGSATARSERSAEIQERIGRATDSSPVRAYLTGPSALNNDLSTVEFADQELAEAIGIPAALIILVIAMRGALVPALLPVITAAASTTVASVLLGLLAPYWHLDRLATVVATTIGIGVGIDYALFLISRSREELQRPPEGAGPTAAAISGALRTSGHAVIVSGLIVIAALGALSVMRSHVFVEIALACAVTVGVTLVAALTLVPALTALLSRTMEWTPFRRRRLDGDDARPDDGRWARWARFVIRYRIAVTIISLALIAAIALPVLQIRLGMDLGIRALGDTAAGRGQHLLTQSFGPGIIGPVDVVTCGPGSVAATQRAASLAAHDDRVRTVLPISRSRGCARASIILARSPDSVEAAEFVRDLRAPSRADRPGGTPATQIGGLTAQYVDLADTTTRSLPLVVGLVLGVSFLYLLVIFRSILIPLKAVALNVGATLAALGATTAVFQFGIGAGVWGSSSTGAIQAYLPVALFALLFGLSMDYEVFLVSRIREERESSGDDTTAIIRGLGHTASQISAAAAIMVVVFGSLLTARVLELRQVGFGLAVAVLLDATLVRLALVPAVMSLAGRYNWWLPGAPQRAGDRMTVGISPPSPLADAGGEPRR